MKRILLETNAYSRYAKGDNEVRKIILKSSEIYISVVTLGELYLGFKEGNREDRNLKLLQGFLASENVKTVDVKKITAFNYAKIKYDLRKKGIPIPENDIWIAAHVIETDSVLVTYDKHFLEVPGLRFWDRLN